MGPGFLTNANAVKKRNGAAEEMVGLRPQREETAAAFVYYWIGQASNMKAHRIAPCKVTTFQRSVDFSHLAHNFFLISANPWVDLFLS